MKCITIDLIIVDFNQFMKYLKGNFIRLYESTIIVYVLNFILFIFTIYRKTQLNVCEKCNTYYKSILLMNYEFIEHGNVLENSFNKLLKFYFFNFEWSEDAISLYLDAFVCSFEKTFLSIDIILDI